MVGPCPDSGDAAPSVTGIPRQVRRNQRRQQRVAVATLRAHRATATGRIHGPVYERSHVPGRHPPSRPSERVPVREVAPAVLPADADQPIQPEEAQAPAPVSQVRL